MNTPNIAVVPTVALLAACLGFALAGPTGLLVAVVLAASAVLPWPLPFALGQVGAAVVFADPALATPLFPFVLVQGGLWLALALSHGIPLGREDVVPIAVASAVALGLLALVQYWIAGSALATAGVVAVVITVVLYVVHRYERVTAGLVSR